MIDEWQKHQYGKMFECYKLCVGFVDQTWLIEKKNGTIIGENIPHPVYDHFKQKSVYSLTQVPYSYFLSYLCFVINVTIGYNIYIRLVLQPE